MNEELARGLIANVFLLLSVSIVYNVVFLRFEKERVWKKAVAGLIVGALGILLMINTARLYPGVFFDARSVLTSVSAMFFGPVTAAVMVLTMCAYRIYAGGTGTVAGITIILLTTLIGLLWNRFRLGRALSRKKIPLLEFYIMGILASLAAQASVMIMPAELAREVFLKTFTIVMTMYPVASVLLCMLLYGSFRNIATRRELAESEAQNRKLCRVSNDRQRFLKSLIDSIPDVIFYKDLNGRYLGCNKAWEKLMGKTESDMIGKTAYDIFESKTAELRNEVDGKVLKLASLVSFDETVINKDNKTIYFETHKAPYFDSEGSIAGIIGICHDITERKRKEEEILYLTFHDMLTGLYNRTFFEEELKRLDTERQLPLSVIVGDINGLKLVNDAFGHAEGDKMLLEMARILKDSSREEDILARVGGDEFYILLPQTGSRIVEDIVERIKKACSEYSGKTDKGSYFASISLGHATKSFMEEPLERTIRNAEEFMYRQKLFEYRSIHSSILSSIKTTMYEKSHETEEHTARLAGLARKLGKSIGLNDEKLVELDLLSALHDIGKIGINGNILEKREPLTDRDWFEIKKHPEIGYRITQASPELIHISQYILSHHERWDGKGYPQGLHDEEIPVLSRIITIVDSYESMTEERVYRRALSREDAVAELKRCGGSQFDPEITEVFIKQVLEGDRN
ncbi:MAG: diguanylate cyclase [Clostridiales bacterium]|nr:diguanylate cyclase [Clostridiales bacterium]